MKRLLPFVMLACEGWNTDSGAPPTYPDLGRTANVDTTPPAGVLGLTFDDGPSAQYTADVLAVLAKHGIHATFFVIGRNIPGNRALLDAEQQQGHQIGNHTYYHEPQPSLAHDVFDQRTLAVKDNIGDRDNGRLYFRFPYGAAAQEQLDWLTALDVGGQSYRAVGWNIDSQDWEFGADYPNGTQTSTSILDDADTCGGQANPFQHDLVGWAEFAARLYGGGVVLFHDIQQITHDHIDEIITGWENPAAYWASLDAATAQGYKGYYACENVSTTMTFSFQPLYGGAWPKLM